jgi:uncharacterized membrane protein YkvA (DUF1232 family)
MARILSLLSRQNAQHGIALFRNRRTMFQMFRDIMAGSYKMSFITLMVLILSVAYILMPFDFIPDFIPFLGWADDGAVFYILFKRLSKEKERYNRYKAMARKGR